MPAAKKGDQIIASDIHVVNIPSPSGTVPTPIPYPFAGIVDGNPSQDVKIMDKPAATVDSTASNKPPHILQGGPFQKNPANKATIKMGISTVKINGKMAARTGDTAMICNDPSDMPVGTVIAIGTVFIG